MAILRLDYQRSIKPFPVAGVILLLLAMAVLAIFGGYYYRLITQMAKLEPSHGEFEHAARRITGKPRETRGVAQEIKQANEVLHQLSLPWESLFQAVESSASREVTLLGMEPDVEKQTVRITCEARNIAAMLNYIKRIEQRHEFGSVYLQSHRAQEKDAERPVRFSLFAVWAGAS